MFIRFSQTGYTMALKKAIERALDRVGLEVYTSVLNSFRNLQIRELDTKYVGEMLASIRTAKEMTTNTIISTIKAGGETKPNQSFRVVYYQYGTGSKMKPPDWYSPAKDPYWNPARPRQQGEVIWQRPFSSWKDAGGNWHTSKTKGKPRPLSEKSRRGKPIEPTYWFTKGFWDGTKNLDQYLLEAVKSVPISAYIRVGGLIKRM